MTREERQARDEAMAGGRQRDEPGPSGPAGAAGAKRARDEPDPDK